ncbi:hypothetical protein H4R18_000027 [Coemansia javaensis]|uniref:Uncharacterized protein n=1 Tax=Coemansia javaensis TaxID=2761396 RepID=A0A9W8HPN7_9FUNG|nr:hypothetical protein H4R18_000027 [Coemansia javaensis]
MRLTAMLPRLLALVALLAAVFASPIPPRPRTKSCLSRVAAAITPANATIISHVSDQLNSTLFRDIRMFEPVSVALGLPSAADFNANDIDTIIGALQSLGRYLRRRVPEAAPRGKPCSDPLAVSLLNIYKNVVELVNELVPPPASKH